MKRNIIKEIWTIRGMVDKAIENQDMDLYNRAVARYRVILDNEDHLKTFSSSTINAGYENLESINWDRENNMAMLTFDLYNLKAQVEGKEIESQEKQFSSVVEVIWYTRSMFDAFVVNGRNKKDTMEANEKIFMAITYNLSGFYDYFSLFSDSVSREEQAAIREIYDEVIDKHYSIYKDKEYIINLSDDHSISWGDVNEY